MIRYQARGFTLVEMAVVIVIIGLLISGMMLPISARMDIEGLRTTNARLEEAKEALLGYAMINGRLPCPASTTSNGVEDPVGGGACSHPYDGYLPAVTLGIMPTDANGYAVDGWSANPSNRIRYAVTTQSSNAFTTAINSLSLSPDLHICASGTNITASTCDTSGVTLTATATAVIFSLGKNAGAGGMTTDEAPNVDNNITFVSHDPSPDFDDQMTWLSYPILVNRLVSAGKLP